MWRADVKHYQEVIKTLSIGIRDGALFSSVDEVSSLQLEVVQYEFCVYCCVEISGY